MKDYEFIIIDKEKDIVEYEKGLYFAFTKMTKSKWREDNYSVIDNCRYKSNYSYDEQIIYGLKKDGKIIMALSIIGEKKDKLLLEKLGFNIDAKIKKMKICEGLDFFSFLKSSMAAFDIYAFFVNSLLTDLKKRGYEMLLGSCSKRLRIFYRQAGYQINDSIILNNEPEYFISRKL